MFRRKYILKFKIYRTIVVEPVPNNELDQKQKLRAPNDKAQPPAGAPAEAGRLQRVLGGFFGLGHSLQMAPTSTPIAQLPTAINTRFTSSGNSTGTNMDAG